MHQFQTHSVVSKQDLLSWSGVPRSSFYYKRGGGLRGRKPSEITITSNGELIGNTVVVKDVESILQQEFCCYGYKNVWDELKQKGYIINHKKVYRLMKIHNLLFNRRSALLVFPDSSFALERSEQKNHWSTFVWISSTSISMEPKEMPSC